MNLALASFLSLFYLVLNSLLGCVYFSLWFLNVLSYSVFGNAVVIYLSEGFLNRSYSRTHSITPAHCRCFKLCSFQKVISQPRLEMALASAP